MANLNPSGAVIDHGEDIGRRRHASIAQKVPEVELRDPSPIVRRLIVLTGLAGILTVTS
jgi:hypothetical protein